MTRQAPNPLGIVAAHNVRRIGDFTVWTGRIQRNPAREWTYEYQRVGDAQVVAAGLSFPHLAAAIEHVTAALTSA
jgi:hypothetical protein